MARDLPAGYGADAHKTIVERVIVDVQDSTRLDAETRLRLGILLSREGARMARQALADLGLEG